MKWTVSRRIIAGFATGAVLVVVIAAMGVWSLRRTANTYTGAIETERQVLVRSVEARGSARLANISYLRFLLDGGPEHLATLNAEARQARAAIGQLQLSADATEARIWADALRALDEWEAGTIRVMALFKAGDTEEGLRVRAELQPTQARLDGVFQAGIDAATLRTDAAGEQAHAAATAFERAMLGALVVALLVFLIAGYLLNRAVAGPLGETVAILATSVNEILATTTEQATGATESLAAVTQTAATVDQVVQTAEQSADRARGVAASAQRAAEIGRLGKEAVETSVTAMEDVRAQVNTIGEKIVALADQAQAIGEIIATVTDIADQTNLLALNAAIEAARAGEQGRGFAVVAGEVRNLAEESKVGTTRVRQLLEKIQRATAAAVVTTEEGNRKVSDVTRQVREAGETIRQLADAVASSAQSSAQIAASAGQQATGMSQIRQAIGSIQQAAQQNLTATKQTESAAQDLDRLGMRLLDLTGATVTGIAERRAEARPARYSE